MTNEKPKNHKWNEKKCVREQSVATLWYNLNIFFFNLNSSRQLNSHTDRPTDPPITIDILVIMKNCLNVEFGFFVLLHSLFVDIIRMWCETKKKKRKRERKKEIALFSALKMVRYLNLNRNCHAAPQYQQNSSPDKEVK